MPSPTRRSSSRKRSAATRIQKRVRGKQTRKRHTRSIEQMYRNLELTNQCAICHESMRNNGPITKLGCGHTFHSECIQRSLRSGLASSGLASCPLCRTPMTITEIQSLRSLRQTHRAIAPQQEQVIEQLLTSRRELEILEQSIEQQRQELPDPPEIPNIDFIQALDNIIRALEILDDVVDLSNRVNNDASEIYRSFNITDEIVIQDISNILTRTDELLRRARNNRSNAQRIAEHINNPELSR
jgi:hypothetical protein